MQELRDKIAVVIGASSGIGRALALALAREGMNLVVAATRREPLEALAAEASAFGIRVIAAPCDVSNRSEIFALRDLAYAEFGTVHLLCNNAGVTTGGPLIEHGDDDWDWICDTVLRGVTHAIQAFAPRMAQAGEGHILNTGSQAALVPDWCVDHGPYVAAKAGVIALTVALRAELESRGVGVSLLIPSMVNTDIIRGSSHRRPQHYGGPATAGGAPHLRERTPMPVPDTRFALEPHEVAAIALEGICANAPFIVTHGGLKPVVEDYFGRILAAYDFALERERNSRTA